MHSKKFTVNTVNVIKAVTLFMVNRTNMFCVIDVWSYGLYLCACVHACMRECMRVYGPNPKRQSSDHVVVNFSLRVGQSKQPVPK